MISNISIKKFAHVLEVAKLFMFMLSPIQKVFTNISLWHRKTAYYHAHFGENGCLIMSSHMNHTLAKWCFSFNIFLVKIFSYCDVLFKIFNFYLNLLFLMGS